MSTTELKSNLFKAIDAIQDGKTLKSIYSFISKKTSPDFWDTLTEEQKTEIDKALKDLHSGTGISHATVMAKYKGKYTWFHGGKNPLVAFSKAKFS
jgi:hypothetical protein